MGWPVKNADPVMKEHKSTMKTRSAAFLVMLLLPVLGAGAQQARFKGLETALLPQKIASETFSYLGTPYVTAGADRSGVDCSGLIYAVFRTAANMELPRMVADLFAYGENAGASLRIGDLVFFDTESASPDPAKPAPPTHVGIYIGGGRVVHAASEGDEAGVKVSSLGEAYYKSRYVGARRIISWAVPVLEMTPGASGDSVSLQDALASGAPLKVSVSSSLTEPLILSASRDGVLIQTRRIPPGGTSSPVYAMTTEAGRWTVTLSTPDTAALLTVSFQVKE